MEYAHHDKRTNERDSNIPNTIRRNLFTIRSCGTMKTIYALEGIVSYECYGGWGFEVLELYQTKEAAENSTEYKNSEPPEIDDTDSSKRYDPKSNITYRIREWTVQS